MMKIANPFNNMKPSPWPITISIALLAAAMSLITKISNNSILSTNTLLSPLLLWMSSMLWWKNLAKEASFHGNHSVTTTNLTKLSMILFIISEIMLFLSFFWAFFHSSISANIEMGETWPPVSIQIFNPMGMPLLNSLILISSGASITWCHHSHLSKMASQSLAALTMTILLGILFTVLQSAEYYNAKFSISDSTYGSIFFLSTGFHGLHVIVGSIFLMWTMKNLKTLTNSTSHFVSLELSAWYWHFVDVVWLFLFTTIYWWGS